MPDTVSLDQKIPARYIGTHLVRLVASLGPHFDADGKRKEDLRLSTGDTLMMPAAEVIGYTQLHRGGQLLLLGLGKVVLPDDIKKNEEELAVAGYIFHLGRTDFEPLTAQEPATSPEETQTPPPDAASNEPAQTEEH
jgi:hypothetical protein